MKLSVLAAAATIALTGLAPGLAAPAAAQHRVVHERTVRHDRHARQVCRWQSRHHRRVRVCR